MQYLIFQAFNAEETLSISTQLMNRNNFMVVLEEILKGKNLNRKKLPPHFSTLLPPDQVCIFIEKYVEGGWGLLLL